MNGDRPSRTVDVAGRSCSEGERHDRLRTSESSARSGRSRSTWASRAEEPDGKTSPEELIAAAHAVCFSMALSGRWLAKAGTPPERLETSATVTFVPGEGITEGRSPSSAASPGSTRRGSSSRPRARRRAARSRRRSPASPRSRSTRVWPDAWPVPKRAGRGQVTPGACRGSVRRGGGAPAGGYHRPPGHSRRAHRRARALLRRAAGAHVRPVGLQRPPRGGRRRPAPEGARAPRTARARVARRARRPRRAARRSRARGMVRGARGATGAARGGAEARARREGPGRRRRT